MKAFKLSRQLLAQIEEQARVGFPYEICGFIAGKTIGSGQQIQAVRNIARNRQVEYHILPEDILATLLSFESQGYKITGIYHSHPRYSAQPSNTDLHLADMPNTCYLVTSVSDKLECETRAWWVEDRKSIEIDLITFEE